jgi:hypothetical protein
MNGTKLVAKCKDFFGNQKETSLENAAACKDIRDVNGDLRCVISAKHADGSHATDFDIISISRDVTVNGFETKVWRIDNPQVWSNTADLNANYPEIAFKPGDAISFNAGGCVQTGGSGRTWKSYVWPQGDGAGNMYAGTAQIQGVTPGGFQRIGGLMGCQPWTVPRPKNPGAPADHFLELGYQDDGLGDNGYYSHDDGTQDQCKNVGPAWVEITVVSGRERIARGPDWSSHCKPFDLTWDMGSEDFNGLPQNPQWAWQLSNPNQQPDFGVMCKDAFPGDSGTTIDATQLAKCTSQDPTADTHWALGAVCDGWPLQGHLNWMIATYTGPVTWEAITTINGFWDCDYNLQLQPQHFFGLTQSGTPPANATALGLEFDPRETINNMGSKWWQQTQGYVMSDGVRTLHDVGDHNLIALFNGTHGLYGVVIGLIGLDANHGAYTESHPVFAMAVRTRRDVIGTTTKDHWAFFLRNVGNEGGCGSLMHHWDSPTGEYFIQLPWPQGATGMNPAVTEVDVTPWQDKTNVGFAQSDNSWTLVRVTPPSANAEFGVDGEFTATYTVPSNVSGSASGAAGGGPPPKRGEREPEEEDVGDRITDTAVRAQFAAEIKTMKLPEAAPTPKIHLAVAPEVVTLEHVPGAAASGKLTRARTGPNSTREQIDAEVIKVAEKYQKDLKVDPTKFHAATATASK